MSSVSNLSLPDEPTLAQYQCYVAEMIKERGFDGENVPKRFMHLMEEVGEFARSARQQSGIKFADDTKRAESASEAADVFILFLGLCNMLDIDLEQAFREKEELNKQRTWK